MDFGRGRRRDRGVSDRRLQPPGPPAQCRARRLERHRRAAQAPHRSRSRTWSRPSKAMRRTSAAVRGGRRRAPRRSSRPATSPGRPTPSGRSAGIARQADGGGRGLSGASRPTRISSNCRSSSPRSRTSIQMARRYYNGAVRDLNISIQSFPDVLVARMLGFREEPFFELESRAEAAAPRSASRDAQRHERDPRWRSRCALAACGRRRRQRADERILRSSATSMSQRNGDLHRHRDDPGRGRRQCDPARHLARFPDRLRVRDDGARWRWDSTSSR